MRIIPVALQTHIQAEVLSLTRCLKITKNDGTIVRLTTHDANLTVGGDVYLAGVALDISAIQSTDELTVDNAEITIGIDGEIIVQTDFDSGLYDNAPFELFIVNWEDTGDGVIPLKRGTLGDIEIADALSVKIQLRGLTQSLQRPIVERYSPTCRVALGSKRCGVVNTPTKIRRNRQKVKTFDWFLVPDANVTTHTVANAGFETAALAGWTVPPGSAFDRANSFTAGAGTYYAEGGSGTTGAELVAYQDFATSALSLADADVDDGDYSVDFAIQIAATSNTFENAGKVYVEQYNSLGQTLRRDESEYVVPEFQQWQGIGVTAFVVPGCRTIRVGFINRIDQGSAGYVAFDAAVLRTWTNEASTWGSRVFRTVRIPAYSSSELYAYSNTNFESGAVGNTNVSNAITGWTIPSTDDYWRVVSSVSGLTPQSGGLFLFGGDDGSGDANTTYEIRQQLTLANGGTLASEATAENIAAGWYYAELRGYSARNDSDSEVRAVVGFYNSGGTLISTLDTGFFLPTEDAWGLTTLGGTVPAGTNSIRTTLYSRSGAGGSAANAGWDNVRLYFTPTAYEGEADEEWGSLASSQPTYDYDSNAYTKDGQVVVQARPLQFAYSAVTAVTSQRVFEASSISSTAALLYSGKITWLSGNNAGKNSYIRIWDNTSKVVKIYDELVGEIQVGDKFVYARGCDKTIDRCADTFGNAHNFRGEPYLPGPSKVIEFLTTETN